MLRLDSHFLWVVITDTSVPQNMEIRMKKKYFPYPKIQVEFIQQSGDKIHDFRCVVYIDGPLLCHEYKNSRTISGEQMYKVFISFKLKSDIF